MEQTKAIAALDLFTTSQVGIDVASDQLIEAVQSGEVNPLKLRVWVKTMEAIIDRVNRATSENQLTEAGKYPGSRFEFAGAIVDKAELGTKYDYRACGDSVWERLSTDMETAKSRLSERETFLKALKEPLTVIDELTAEVVKISPPIKTSVSGLKVTIR